MGRGGSDRVVVNGMQVTAPGIYPTPCCFSFSLMAGVGIGFCNCFSFACWYRTVGLWVHKTGGKWEIGLLGDGEGSGEGSGKWGRMGWRTCIFFCFFLS